MCPRFHYNMHAHTHAHLVDRWHFQFTGNLGNLAKQCITTFRACALWSISECLTETLWGLLCVVVQILAIYQNLRSFLGWMVTRNLNLATNWSAHAQIFTRVYTGKIPQISCNCDIVHCTGHVQWTSILYTLPNFAVHGGRGRGLHVGVNKPLFTPYNLLQQLICWAFCTLVPLLLYYQENLLS